MNTRLISKYLCYLRKEHRFTQEDLAKELNISRQAISKWETGNTLPELETLLKLSKLFQISINGILEPTVPLFVIENFEQITEIPETELKTFLSCFDVNTVVKASMGASPEVNGLLARLLPNIDFKEEQAAIGRLKITDVEEAQLQIMTMINLNNENND